MTRPLRYLSVCSGIEAATQAWHPLGWQPVAFSEIEPHPCAVLTHHYPHVPNWGDMTKFEEWPDADVDVLCGGTLCQSFSVAGLRKGLADPRGNLMLTFGAIAARYRPRWLVWENVPGVLSSNGGRDFGTFLGMLGELGYGVAYRVLDAQHVRTRRFPYAVPQRRRRVFVVGYLGDWRRAAAVLFDRESLSGNPAPRREAGQRPAPTIAERTRGGGGLGTDFDCDGGLITSHSPACTLTARERKGPLPEADLSTVVAHALRGEGFDAREDGTGRGTPLVPISFGAQNAAAQGDGVAFNFVPALDKSKTPAVAWALGSHAGAADGEQANARHDSGGPVGLGIQEGVSYSLRAGRTQACATPWAVRRLTPRECERLQGFPDDFTQIPYRGKPADQCPDGPRYKDLGNSMAVNVMEWLGERIAMIDAMEAAA